MNEHVPGSGEEPDTQGSGHEYAGLVPSARAQRIASMVRWGLILAFAALAVAGAAIGLGPQHCGGSGDGAAGGQQYQCPMHPQVQKDRPGECPICGMDLVRVEPHNAPARENLGPAAPVAVGPTAVPGRAAVHIDDVRVRRIGVVSVPVTEEPFAVDIVAPAQVAIDETRVSVVDTRFAGLVSDLRVRAPGVSVTRGQRLAKLTSSDLYQAEAELAAVVRSSAALGASGEALLAPARARLAALGVHASELQRVFAGGEPRSELVLSSPRSGVLVGLGVAEGAYVGPGTALFTIADLDSVWVLADVAESDSAYVHVGDEASVEAALSPGRKWLGRVTLIEPLVDPETRTRRARVEVSNPGGELVPGAVASARFTRAPRQTLLVPRDAVLTSEAYAHVFVDKGDGRFEPRMIQIGMERDGEVEVISGLSRGERVASVAAFLIDAESRLLGARGTAPAGNAPAPGSEHLGH